MPQRGRVADACNVSFCYGRIGCGDDLHENLLPRRLLKESNESAQFHGGGGSILREDFRVRKRALEPIDLVLEGRFPLTGFLQADRVEVAFAQHQLPKGALDLEEILAGIAKGCLETFLPL